VATKTTRPAPSDLERQIDALYQRPLNEFTAARNALAKTLAGDDAERVKRLGKPTVIPWTVNQVYWHARSVYDQLIEAGAAVRKAQIAAIEKPGTSESRARQGKDRVRDAADAHRKAIADAVHQAVRLSGQAGVHPPAEALTRTLEALSLSPPADEPPGRLTEVVQPAGFEALFGVVPAGRPAAAAGTGTSAPPAPISAPARDTSAAAPRQAAEAARARAAAHKEQVQAAHQAVAAARDAERHARVSLDEADRALRDAERAADRARASRDDARTRLERASHDYETAQRALDRLKSS
jgi:hypothetical protein